MRKVLHGLVERYTTFQRFVHIHMIHLGALNVLTGLPLILPEYFKWLGYLFGGWVWDLTTGLEITRMVHRASGVLIVILGILYFIRYFYRPGTWDIAWKKGDFERLKRLLAHYTKGEHVDFDKYNPGEKLYFWLAVIPAGLLLGISGLILILKDLTYIPQSWWSTALLAHDLGFWIILIAVLVHVYFAAIFPPNRLSASMH